MHLITEANYAEANDAVRDILMMYVDMAYSTAGFGHSSDVHVRFDPLKFVDAESDGEAYYVDLELLRAGSAVAILCEFYNLWCEEQYLSGPHVKPYEDAMDQGRLRSFPDIEGVIREAIRRHHMPIDSIWFENAVLPIYRAYVLDRFATWAASDRFAAYSPPSNPIPPYGTDIQAPAPAFGFMTSKIAIPLLVLALVLMTAVAALNAQLGLYRHPEWTMPVILAGALLLYLYAWVGTRSIWSPIPLICAGLIGGGFGLAVVLPVHVGTPLWGIAWLGVSVAIPMLGCVIIRRLRVASRRS